MTFCLFPRGGIILTFTHLLHMVYFYGFEGKSTKYRTNFNNIYYSH